VSCFHIQVGNCAKCGKRIQGRDGRQTSDAVGAAASQVGPEALSLATILNKELGIPLGKTTAILDKAFGLTLTPGGLSQALARLGEKCEPTYQDLDRRFEIHSLKLSTDLVATCAAIRAGIASQTFKSFFGDDRSH
jgi:hypothetical protein